MISGFLGEEDAILFEIELITADELKLPVEALLDTGFSHWLAMRKARCRRTRIGTSAGTSNANGAGRLSIRYLYWQS